MKLPRRRFLHLAAGAAVAPGCLARRDGASLSDAADDDGRAVLGGRPDRHDCAHHGRADADIARADRHRREYDGRRRHHRRRSGGARGARRLHDVNRPLGHACGQRRDL